MLENPLQYKSSKIPQPNTIPVANEEGKLDPEWASGGESFDPSQHSVTEFNDVTDAGSGKIITDTEREKLLNDSPTFEKVTVKDNIRFEKADIPEAKKMLMTIGDNGEIELAPPLTTTIEYSDSDNSDVPLDGNIIELLSVTVTDGIPASDAGYMITFRLDNTVDSSRTVFFYLRKNGNVISSGSLNLQANEVDRRPLLSGGFADDISNGDVFTLELSATGNTGDVIVKGSIAISLMKIKSYQSSTVDAIRWNEENDILQPKNANAKVKLPDLTGRDNSIVVTDASGMTKDTKVQIEEIASGSAVTMEEFLSEPTEKIPKDLYVVSDGTTTKLKWFDGTDVWSIDMTKE